MDLRLPIAITLGDPAGIGPEIVVRLFQQGLPHPAVVVGDLGAVKRAVTLLNAGIEILQVPPDDIRGSTEQRLPLIATSDVGGAIEWGVVDGRAGKAACDAIVAGAKLALAGKVAGIVTAPINKEAMVAGGAWLTGHTELLADISGNPYVAMMLLNDELRVILVSAHLSLSDAITAVTRDTVERTIRFADEACRSLGLETPRIAVAGLNPHAGENGLFGREEIAIIAPAVQAAQNEGLDVTGPYSPDTVFMRALRGEFDIVVAQYHDQGLIPIKLYGLDRGVNVTVGLPFVRTSVDHGTAFEIAGQGKADPASLRAAFDLAVAMSSRMAEDESDA